MKNPHPLLLILHHYDFSSPGFISASQHAACMGASDAKSLMSGGDI